MIPVLLTALKSPAAFHEQIKSLERARTENFLKHKIRSRPDRSELVRMHILEGKIFISAYFAVFSQKKK